MTEEEQRKAEDTQEEKDEREAEEMMFNGHMMRRLLNETKLQLGPHAREQKYLAQFEDAE